jgi:hypothetical protein
MCSETDYVLTEIVIIQVVGRNPSVDGGLEEASACGRRLGPRETVKSTMSAAKLIPATVRENASKTQFRSSY